MSAHVHTHIVHCKNMEPRGVQRMQSAASQPLRTALQRASVRNTGGAAAGVHAAPMHNGAGMVHADGGVSESKRATNNEQRASLPSRVMRQAVPVTRQVHRQVHTPFPQSNVQTTPSHTMNGAVQALQEIKNALHDISSTLKQLVSGQQRHAGEQQQPVQSSQAAHAPEAST